MIGSAHANALTAAIDLVVGGASLSADQTSDAFDVIMRGEGTNAQIRALLMALATKGGTAQEVAGGAPAMRTAMLPFDTMASARLADTCGPGGGALSAFNTTAAEALR